jgi:integrase
MASITRHGTGWRAHVHAKGKRASKVFATKAEARDWAARQEYLAGHATGARDQFGDVLDRYARQVSPTKRGARWEMLRIEAMRRDPVAKVQIGSLTSADLAGYRDRRLAQVSPGTVRRELTLLAAVLTQARREWGLIAASPMADVRQPAEPPPRDRRPTADELERLAHAAGGPEGMVGRAWLAFLFSIETGMRAGEVCGLRPGHVTGQVARLPMTKNGRAREVPLSAEALRIWQSLPAGHFALTPRQLDSHWRKLRGMAKVEGLTYHDSRHEAVSRLSRRLDVLALARMIGHRNLSQLMVYYNASAADLAERLD